MSDALSFAEIDGQHLELLPARTVLISMNPSISVDHILEFTGGTATSGAAGTWSLPNVATAALAPGVYTFYAGATDNYGALSAVASTTDTVNPAAPSIAGLGGVPAAVDHEP